MPKGRTLRVDPEAKSASPTDPAFVAKPPGAPVYHGFPVLESSLTDGWKLGIISDPSDSNASQSLDGFVVAPDGSRAGIVWEVAVTEIRQILGPSSDRWGVFSVPLARPIRSEEELIMEFRRVLPALQELWTKAHDA